MDHFESAFEFRQIGCTHNYGHSIHVKTLDETLFGDTYNEFNRERTEKLIRTLHTRDGIGGCYVTTIQYKGVVGVREIPNPYHPDRPYEYKIHRTEFQVRVSGTD